MKFLKLLTVLVVYITGLWFIPTLVARFNGGLEFGPLIFAWSVVAFFTTLLVLEGDI